MYPEYIDPEWVSQPVLDVIKSCYWSFIPRRGSGRRAEVAVLDDAAPRAVRRAADGLALSPEELTALFAETRPSVIEEMRCAADDLRSGLAGETVTFVVNRNVNVSNICVVGCAFCGFGQARRSPDAYEHSEEEFARRVAEAVEFGATEICIQSGIHPDWGLGDYEKWLRLAKEVAPDLHLHAYSPMEVAHMCDVSGLSPRAVFERLRDAGLDSTPGTAAEVLHDGVRERISPNKLPVARWVEIIEASHASGLRSTVTVMFGHIEEPWELAEHMRVVRELQERTGGFTEFVPLSFIPFHTLLGPHPRRRGDLPRGEPQAHRGVPARARQDRAQPAGELGQDGTRGGDRVPAMGRQRPRRDPDGGVDLTDGRQLSRCDAGPRTTSSGRPIARAGRRPNGPRCTTSAAGTRCRRQPRERRGGTDARPAARRRCRRAPAVSVRWGRAARGVRRAALEDRDRHVLDRVL